MRMTEGNENDEVVDRSSPWWERLKAIVIASAKEFGEDKAGRMAAALAYYTLFSLVPLLFVAVSISSLTLGPSERELPEDCSTVVDEELGDEPLDRLVAEVDRVAGEAVADPVRVIMCGARKSAGATLGIGLLIAAFSASGIFLQAQGVLNAIFGAPEEKVTGIMGIVRQRTIALLSALLLSVLVIVPVIAVGAIQFLTDLLPLDLDWLRPVVALVVPIVSLLLLVVVVAVTFQVLTAATIPGRAARWGGTVTALVGLVAAFVVGTFLGNSTSSTLGVLGGLAVLLLFFNLMWNVYLFGAEITKTYSDYLEHGDIVQASVRAERVRKDDTDEQPGERRRREEPEPIRIGPALAMVVGLLIGRLGERRE